MIFVETNVLMFAVGEPHPLRAPARAFLQETILADRFSGLGARDLLHLACCRRYAAEQIKTFDRGLAAAFAKG